MEVGHQNQESDSEVEASAKDNDNNYIAQLQERIIQFKDMNLTSGRDIVAFLQDLPINNHKSGNALSWNRALKTLKQHNAFDNYKPYSQMKVSEKADAGARLAQVIDDEFLNELRVSNLMINLKRFLIL